MNKNKHLNLDFGALAAFPLRTQLKHQGFRIIAGAEVEQLDADAIVRLHLHKLLTDSQAKQAQQKLMKHITKLVRCL